MTKLSCLKNKSVLIDIAVEHFFLNVLKFTFRQVVKDKVVFKAVNDEVGVMKGFLFGDEFNILRDSGLDGFDFFGFVMCKELSLGFGSDG